MYDDTMLVDKAYYNKLKEQTTWVSVKERMPESGSTVLVLWDDRYLYNGREFKNRIIQIAICCNDDFRSKIFVSDDNYHAELPHVTHWMSLPEPPKE